MENPVNMLMFFIYMMPSRREIGKNRESCEDNKVKRSRRVHDCVIEKNFGKIQHMQVFTLSMQWIKSPGMERLSFELFSFDDDVRSQRMMFMCEREEFSALLGRCFPRT